MGTKLIQSFIIIHFVLVQYSQADVSLEYFDWKNVRPSQGMYFYIFA